MPFRLFASDGVTPVAVPQTIRATWGRVDRDTYADGTARTARGRVVEWTFKGAISDTAMGLIATARPENGKVLFETWRGRKGGAAAGFVKCSGILAEPDGVERDGEWHGVILRFTRVVEV